MLMLNVKLNAIDDSVGKVLRTADLRILCMSTIIHSHLPLIL
jgi:hypothetical protein